MCGLTRETTSIQLAKLRKEGLIAGGKILQVNTVILNKLKPKLAIAP